MAENISPNHVKSSVRTLDILEVLAGNPEGITLSEISRKLTIPPSSMYHLLNTMMDREYIIRDPRDSTFYLGKKIVFLYEAYLFNSDLIRIARPVMDRLYEITGETSSLGVLQGNKVVFIHKRLVSSSLGILDPLGTRKLAHATASGKAMLAFLPQAELDALYPDEQLPVSTQNTICTREQLRQVLSDIKRCGYAYEDEESKLGVWAVAACIIDHSNTPIAALSVVGPSLAISTENKQKWSTNLVEAATEISYRLGYSPNTALRRGDV
jgi:DNA-binding IclR family transcriptional regulator